jgi:hypothetical protein
MVAPKNRKVPTATNPNGLYFNENKRAQAIVNLFGVVRIPQLLDCCSRKTLIRIARLRRRAERLNFHQFSARSFTALRSRLLRWDGDVFFRPLRGSDRLPIADRFGRKAPPYGAKNAPVRMGHPALRISPAPRASLTSAKRLNFKKASGWL